MQYKCCSNINVDSILSNHLFFRSTPHKVPKASVSKKIRLYDHSCKYYIKITQQIHKITNYKEMFSTYERCECTDLAIIDESYIQKISTSVKPKQYVLITYNNESNSVSFSFTDFLLNQEKKNAKHFLFQLIH